MEVRSTLPDHPVPESAEQLAAQPVLQVCGLVAQPLALSRADLVVLTRSSFIEDFRCEDNWSVPNQKWVGIRLADVLALAGPLPAAKFVRVGAGEYVTPISLEDARDALLCESLNDVPLTLKNGAPWRLSAPGAACFASVKWVDRLDLTAEPGANDAERITRERGRSRAGAMGE
jgi:DMSO/TMAO reductase YedYZ molybdopterin-dependent catalytic subunit